MKREVTIYISRQADDMLKFMPEVDGDAFLDWFCDVRKISAGGGDLICYLEYLKDKEKRGNKND